MEGGLRELLPSPFHPPPSPFVTPSWSSLEWTVAAATERGFISHRGRSRQGKQRRGKSISKAAKLKPLRLCGFDSHPGHWQRDVFPAAGCKPAVTKQAGWRRGGSIPSRLIDDEKVHCPVGLSVGRQVLSLERLGSIPARGIDGRVVELADTRRSERRAARHGSSTLPLVTKFA